MLENISKNKIIIKKTKILDTSMEQGRGLMFSSRKKFDYALIFVRDYESRLASAIHMCFVFFPIKILFLNSRKEVVDIKHKIYPFGFYMPRKKAKYIIELPINTKLNNTEIGDKINWN